MRPDLVSCFYIDADCRLVENKQLRIVQKRARNRESTLHSAGEVAHRIVGAGAQPDEIENFSNSRVGVLNIVECCSEFEILPRTHFGVESGLLGENTDLRAELSGILRNILTEYPSCSSGWSDESAGHIDERRFACAVRADDTDDCARRDAQRNAGECADFTELADYILDVDRGRSAQRMYLRRSSSSTIAFNRSVTSFLSTAISPSPRSGSS